MALDARSVINFVEKILSGAEGVGTDVEIPRQSSWRLQSVAFWTRGHGKYPILVESALAWLQGKIFRGTEQIEGGS